MLELFATAAAVQRYPELVPAGAPVFLVTESAAAALSDTVTPQGLVAVCATLDVPLARALGGEPRLVAVLVGAADPGNLGTVIRVADAAGADAVLLAGDTVDPHIGKCVRASAGSLFHLPIGRHRDVAEVLDAVKAAGLTPLAADAGGELNLDEADDVLAGRTAWLFGGEAHGLAAEVAASADHRVRVPIHGQAESLNLATAAAVCLYASARAHPR